MSAEQLAAFVAGLPEGKRHAGTFWALNAAVEDDLPASGIKKITDAAVRIGLDEDYLARTLHQIEAEGP